MRIEKELMDYHRITSARNKVSTNEIDLIHIRNMIKCFHIHGIKSLSKVKYNTGYLIIEYLKNNTRNHNNSINKHLRLLKAAMRNYKIFTDFHDFKPLSKDTKPFMRLFHEDLKLVFDYLKNMNYTKNSKVYRTMIFLLLDSGMRIGELLAVKISNIDFEAKRIYLETTKTGKTRYAPFSDFSYEYVKDLVDADSNRIFLFWNFLKDRQLSYHYDVKNFYKRLKSWLSMNRIHSHRFRKTFASLLSENGMPLDELQKLLDHSKITTTIIYVQHHHNRALNSYNNYNKWNI